jgi:hypothetical protein
MLRCNDKSSAPAKYRRLLVRLRPHSGPVAVSTVAVIALIAPPSNSALTEASWIFVVSCAVPLALGLALWLLGTAYVLSDNREL